MPIGLGVCGCRCATTTPSCGTLCITSTGCTLATILPGVGITLTYTPVVSVAVSNGGSGYTVAPAVVFATTNGSGAVATANLTGGVVTSITVTTGGAYNGSTTASFAGGVGGTGAVAGAVTLGSPVTAGTGTTTGQLTAIARTNAGSGYTSPPDVTIGGVGTGATAIAIISGPISSVTVDNVGSNYTTAPTATLTPSTGGGSLRVLLTASTVASVTPVLGGTYLTANPIPTVTLATPTGHTGSGATASARMSASAVSVLSGGTGYTVGNVLTLSGGTFTAAATINVTAVGGGGAITGVSVASGGSYSAYPTAPIGVTGGTGSGATLNLNWRVGSIVVTNAGSNYSTAPTVTFSAGAATATAALVATTIASVTVVSGGTYVSPPAIALTGGGGGTGGALTAVIATYSVGGFTVTNPGSGYAQASTTVTVTAASGGPGSGATGNATVVVQVCIPIPTAGRYSYVATRPSGTHYEASKSGSNITATCSNTVNVDLAADAANGYRCAHAGCCPTTEDGPPPFLQNYPPATITVNDGIGSVSLTSSNPTASNAVWTGCTTRTAANGYSDPSTCTNLVAGLSVNVGFQLTCFSSGVLQLAVIVGGCGVGSGCQTNYPTNAYSCATGSSGGFCTAALQDNIAISCAGGTLSGTSAAFSFPGGGPGSTNFAWYNIYGGGVTFSLSG